jgi:hypothetical protein
MQRVWFMTVPTSGTGRFLCLLIGAALVAATSSLALAGSSDHPAGRPLLALTAGHYVFSDDSMKGTYGSPLVLGLRVYEGLGPSSQYFLALQFSSHRGNPFYGDPVFEGDRSARLTMLSIGPGFRRGGRLYRDLKLYFGLALEYSRIWETMPGDDELIPAAHGAEPGWGGGLRFLAAPEWTLASGRWVLGSEFSFDPHRGDFSHGRPESSVNLSRSAIHVQLMRRI